MKLEERRLLLKVAKLYYFEGWTQNEISKKVAKSRPIISKLLKQAKEKKIVEVYIKDETLHTVELERIIESKYGLNEAIVVSTSNSGPEMVLRNLGKAAADYVNNKLDDITTIGISWGKSVHALVEAFPFQERKHVHLTPLIGGMGQKFVHYHSNHLTFQMAQKLNTSSSYLYAPAMVESAELRNHIIGTKDVHDVLQKGREVDLAIVGVGNPTNNNTMVEMGYLTEEDRNYLVNSSAVGDINSKFFDSNGDQVEHSLNDRTIGIDLLDLQRIPEVVAIVNGVHKIEGLHIALQKKYLSTVVLDDITARALTELTN
ncbi:DNA-binding transcriptional regulator LsrR, DeoR family [Oceanobacillus limi]|uniref:DNA-binding transcriptional regulator LsrR, DeoR family n=1 Tax=Oceanobacillus limi TaxID=930131 RepID=A0A1I0ACY6_9BACI|nr:sugar-binding transcriptional regulator [Oceanobacillus limi]SES92006.1 DNA-binding transcriptional regulator LsrR, DeoR family [Oceanobacillus limi]